MSRLLDRSINKSVDTDTGAIQCKHQLLFNLLFAQVSLLKDFKTIIDNRDHIFQFHKRLQTFRVQNGKNTSTKWWTPSIFRCLDTFSINMIRLKKSQLQATFKNVLWLSSLSIINSFFFSFFFHLFFSSIIIDCIDRTFVTRRRIF